MQKCLIWLLFLGVLAGCQKPDSPAKTILAPTLTPAPVAKKNASWVRYPNAQITLSPQAQLGKHLFFDASLSASGQMSCATCHQPEHAYAPANTLAVQLGGEKLDQSGTRAVPSLRYLTYTPMFTRHYYLPNAEGLEDEGPAGGFTHDGAVSTLHEQALIPLLSSNEMANLTAATVAKKIHSSSYFGEFQQVFDAQAEDDMILHQVGVALEAFQFEDPSFHPYTSKFDAVVSGNATFSEAEMHGYQVFNNPAKGNCAKCHIATVGAGGKPAQFTDFAFEAVGVPRNPAIPANKSPGYSDLGICGPYRKDMAKETQFCGMFKTPTLRNASERKVFFHNGYFHSMEEVVHFYAERDSKPEKWYPQKAGRIQMYDDLPRQYHANIDHANAPFSKTAGKLSEDEMNDLVTFLATLTDGYTLTAGGELP